MTEQGKVKRKPTLAESLMAVLFLIIIIVVGNVFFGLSVELMFVVAIFFVGYIGKRCGFTYKEIKDGMIGCVAENAEMMVIMLGIGFVIYATMLCWFTPYQNLVFLPAFNCMQNTISHRGTIKACFVYEMLSLTAFLISVPYWKWLGCI